MLEGTAEEKRGRWGQRPGSRKAETRETSENTPGTYSEGGAAPSPSPASAPRRLAPQPTQGCRCPNGTHLLRSCPQ